MHGDPESWSKIKGCATILRRCWHQARCCVVLRYVDAVVPVRHIRFKSVAPTDVERQTEALRP
jgi:hypothetical protein